MQIFAAYWKNRKSCWDYNESIIRPKQMIWFFYMDIRTRGLKFNFNSERGIQGIELFSSAAHILAVAPLAKSFSNSHDHFQYRTKLKKKVIWAEGLREAVGSQGTKHRTGWFNSTQLSSDLAANKVKPFPSFYAMREVLWLKTKSTAAAFNLALA